MRGTAALLIGHFWIPITWEFLPNAAAVDSVISVDVPLGFCDALSSRLAHRDVGASVTLEDLLSARQVNYARGLSAPLSWASPLAGHWPVPFSLLRVPLPTFTGDFTISPELSQRSLLCGRMGVVGFALR